MYLGILFFGLWFFGMIGVCVFRCISARDVGWGYRRQAKRMDGSYWGVYPHTVDPKTGKE